MDKKQKVAILGSTLALLGGVAVISPAQAGEPERRNVTVKVRNKGAYVGRVGIWNGSYPENWFSGYRTGGSIGSGYIGVNEIKTIEAMAPEPEVFVYGAAVFGKDKHYRIPVHGVTRCYEFGGTTIIGFKFEEVSCDGF